MRRIFLVFLCLGLLILPIRAEAAVKYAALTFDDGPSGRFTRRLLDGLKERDAKATFFLCGYRIETYPREARRIAEEGHEIGNHGYSHDSMCPMTKAQVAREIEKTAALLPAGVTPAFVRPPGGMCSDAVYGAAGDAGLAVVSWSVDPKDWRIHDAAAVTRTVTGNVCDGDIILMHDMSDSSVNAALAIVDALQKQGYRFVTLSQLAALRGCALTPGKIYEKFPPDAGK